MASAKNELVPAALATLPTLETDGAGPHRNIDNEIDDNDNTSKKEHEDLEPVTQSIQAVIPLKYRLTALAMVLFISTGTAFAEVTMGPLKSTLQRELKLNSMSSGIHVAVYR
jgi:hypothetical protein